MERVSLLAVCIPVLGLAAAFVQTAYAGCEVLSGKGPPSDEQLLINLAGDWRQFNEVAELPGLEHMAVRPR